MPVNRRDEGVRIVKELGDLIRQDVEGFHVPSRSEPGNEYLVNLPERSCECPDYQYRHNRCAHVWAAMYYVVRKRKWERARKEREARKAERIECG